MKVLCQGYDISRSGAIICKHVARQGLPILHAQRDGPVRDLDTGWQFTCDVHNHQGAADGEVWRVHHVIERDLSIAEIIDNPPRPAFNRSGDCAPWKECDYESED